ncbi:DUF4097 family beta strand repeat-containing protein [Heyndrickxia sp. NPDC080065]|uniref:DUF4097 family beta strand repeat-containing protein n=1 Tax=Heyndrickxia sp. NPDC080065 TaxID=3390568 RepID=UPI003CFC1FBA
MKKMVTGALILLVIGLIGTVSTLYFYKGSLFNPVEWSEKKSISSNEINDIKINSASTDLVVEKTNGKDVQIELMGKETKRKKGEYKLKVEKDNGVLLIKVEQKINWGLTFYKSIKLNVKLPEKMYQTLNVKTSSGKLTITDFQADNATIQSTSGDIKIEDGEVNNDLSIEATSGQIKAIKNRANNMSLKATSGDITSDNGRAAKNFSIHVTSGKVQATNNEAEKVTMKSTSGDINIQQLSAKDSKISATSGTIDIDDISGTIIANASSGDIEIGPNEQIGNTDIETTSGGVKIKTKQKSIPFTFDFKGSSGVGDVNVIGATYTEKSEHDMVGKIGSGKIQLKVRTSSGDFELR